MSKCMQRDKRKMTLTPIIAEEIRENDMYIHDQTLRDHIFVTNDPIGI